jgi:hypothetical protein
MFDKILLLLLILLLPLGILASRLFTGELKIGSSLSNLQEQKIQALVDKLNQQATKPDSVGGKIQVTAAIYSSESATLNISGIAPQTQNFLWVWTAGARSKKIPKVASASTLSESPIWNGPMVLSPREGGIFTAVIDVSQMAGIAEVRIEQGTTATNIRYDLDKKLMLQ